MKKYFIVLSALLLFACGSPSGQITTEVEPLVPDPVQELMDSMTLHEKIGQLFCIRPESYDATLAGLDTKILPKYHLQEVNGRMRKVIERYPAGGIILFAHNIKDPEHIKAFTDSLHALPGAPLIYVDEEGGRVARVGNNPAFAVPKYRSTASVGSSGNPMNAYAYGLSIGTYLKDYGFDVDFAPVADVNTNPQNPIIGTRAFSSDPAAAAPMVAQCVKGMTASGIVSCAKHFPGHGDTQSDTHLGYAQSLKSWEEMLGCEMLPFRAAIDAEVPMVMVAHISTPNVTGSDLPASLSPVILQDKLRGELGFNGIIVTDALAMGAIANHYSPAEAAIRTLQAGSDIILCPKNYASTFDAVEAAVADGTLSEKRIDQSVRRILELKLRLRGSL